MQFTLSFNQEERLKEWQLGQAEMMSLLLISKYKKGYADPSTLEAMEEIHRTKGYVVEPTYYEYTFRTNNIGPSIKVRCLPTDNEIDLTDYSKW